MDLGNEWIKDKFDEIFFIGVAMTNLVPALVLL